MKAKTILPDNINESRFQDVIVRKGTVGAFIINAKAWLASTPGQTEHNNAEQDIVEAVPALRALGLFDILAIRDPALQKLVDSA